MTELETLKAQLAQLKAIINQELASYEQFSRLCARQMQNDDAFRYRTVATVLRAILERDETALRSAPPRGPDSALTADVAQNMRSTAGSWYAQFPLAKTNAGEERKDLEQVPAARTDETRPVESAPLGERAARSGDGNQSPAQKERDGPQDSPSRSQSEQLAKEIYALVKDVETMRLVELYAVAKGREVAQDILNVTPTRSFAIEKSEWISVEERLPYPGEDVLIAGTDFVDISQRADEPYEKWHLTWNYEFENSKPLGTITHWQPLPAPPSPAREKEKAE